MCLTGLSGVCIVSGMENEEKTTSVFCGSCGATIYNVPYGQLLHFSNNTITSDYVGRVKVINNLMDYEVHQCPPVNPIEYVKQFIIKRKRRTLDHLIRIDSSGRE